MMSYKVRIKISRISFRLHVFQVVITS